MIGCLRTLSAGGFIMTILLASGGTRGSGEIFAGDELAFLLLALVFGFMIVFAWTPLLGEIVCRPITNAIEGDRDVEEITFLLCIADWLLRRKWRRFGLFFCCWEALIHPGWPTPCYAAMKNSKPGSWLEHWFAQRVWNGRNAHFCLEARQTLERHGVDVGLHGEPEIARLLASWDRKPSTDPPDPVSLEKHVNRPPARDDRITLFELEESATPGAVRIAPPTVPVSRVASSEESIANQDKRNRGGGVPERSCSVDARKEPLKALMERDGGVQLHVPGPGAVVEWLRESFANSLIRSVDAKAPEARRKTPVRGPKGNTRTRGSS